MDEKQGKEQKREQEFQEWYLKNNKLIGEERWRTEIKKICSVSEEVLLWEGVFIRAAIEKILLASVEKRLPRDLQQGFGVMFSGGIDSTLIALISKKLEREPICFCVGIEKSKDLEWAKRVSHIFGFELFTRVFKLSEVKKILNEVVGILKTNDVVKIGVGCVSYAAMELAASKGINIVFSGLGSEELFAGYERHMIALKEGRDVNKECLKGLYNMYERDFLREAGIAKHFRIQLRTPFLDRKLIKFVMKVAPELKISHGQNKIILRKVAFDFGIPEEIALRKKCAAQYGSGFDRAIEKLAKLNGFNYKADYIKEILSKLP